MSEFALTFDMTSSTLYVASMSLYSVPHTK